MESSFIEIMSFVLVSCLQNTYSPFILQVNDIISEVKVMLRVLHAQYSWQAKSIQTI